MRKKLYPVVISVAAAIGCGGEHGPMSMTGPNGMGYGAALVSVAPEGGSTAVPTSTSITLRFGAAMAVATEEYVDLHRGGLAGPVVPMSCGWSADRSVLTCTPRAPLEPRTTYVVHVGGGMMTQTVQRIDYAQYGPMMGGQWVMGGMMGPNHGGSPWDMMGSGWRNPNGSYGMEFVFTTA